MIRKTLLLSALGYVCSWAQGGGAIITSVMPPAGSGYQGLQSGGAFAEGAASHFYNPATLTGIQRTTGSQLDFSHSSEDLLPVPNLPDLNRDFLAVAAVLPDPQGYDVGVGFFRNETNFGPNQMPDGSIYNGNENVYALGIGLRLGIPFSIGGSAKYYDSHLIGGKEGHAYGWAFDAGFLLNPMVQPFGFLGLRSLDVTPALGYALQNLGPDAFYADAGQSDPIPTSCRSSIAHKLGFSTPSRLPKRKIGNRISPGGD